MTPAEQHALVESLLAADLAPASVRELADIGYYSIAGQTYWVSPDTNAAPLTSWRPWCDIAAVWHLVERYRLTIAPVAGVRDYWRVEQVVEPYAHAEHWREGSAAAIPTMVCQVALALRAREQREEKR